MTGVTGGSALMRWTLEALRCLREGSHRLLNLPFVGLAQNRSENLLYPHAYLLARYLTCGGTALTCSG